MIEITYIMPVLSQIFLNDVVPKYNSFSHAFSIWNHWLKVNGEMKTRDIYASFGYNDNDARRPNAMT